MADQSKEEKTEQPTSRKLDEARKKGNIPRSQEINSALILLTGIMLLSMLGPWILNRIEGIMYDVFAMSAYYELTQNNLLTMLMNVGIETGLILAPIMMIIMVVGIASTLFQGGFVLSGENLKPKLSKMDPVKVFKKIFSLRSLVKLVMSLGKVIPISFIVYKTIKDSFPMILQLGKLDIYPIVLQLASVAKLISNRICLLLVVLAIADYFYQRWQFKDSMKMSKQELKDEMKNTEGDPRIKRHIRKMQFEVAMRRMMSSVPQADVVITNPTHLAVALQYTPGMEAPVVVAKGAKLIAERIRELAQLHDVPLVENKPLARTLFSSVEVGDQVPEYLFTAVAEILAYVYQLKNQRLYAS